MRDKLCHSDVLVFVEAPIRFIMGVTVFMVALRCRMLHLRLGFSFFEVFIFKVIKIFVIISFD